MNLPIKFMNIDLLVSHQNPFIDSIISGSKFGVFSRHNLSSVSPDHCPTQTFFESVYLLPIHFLVGG